MGVTSKDDRLRAARAYLAAVAEPPARALAGFVAEHGAVRAAEAVVAGTEPAGVAEEVATRREHVRAAQLLHATHTAGARLLVPEDPDWPAEPLRVLAEGRAVGVSGVVEPLALWARGDAAPAGLLDRAVAVVGARAASAYGEHVAAGMAHDVAGAGWTVVSGAAYGIDGAAHRGALAADRRTVAFLACGIDRDYPSGHGRLLRAIAGQGVVLTEYPPGTQPRKHRFLVRNRLIAAGGTATVVVEAGARSGAVSTANHADALGRPVLAVPGPVTAKNSVGCHELVRSGRAVLATSAADLLELLQPCGQFPDQGDGCAPAVGTVPNNANVSALAGDVLDALRGRAKSGDTDGCAVEEIALHVGVPVRRVRAAVPELELAGLIRRAADGGGIVLAGKNDQDAPRLGA